jgi:hypothetical protein
VPTTLHCQQALYVSSICYVCLLDQLHVLLVVRLASTEVFAWGPRSTPGNHYTHCQHAMSSLCYVCLLDQFMSCWR